MQTMSRKEERSGTRWAFIGAAVVALAAGFGLLAWFFVPGFSQPVTPKNAGIRSDQTVGVSVQSEKTEPLPGTRPNSTASDAVQRNEQLTGTEAPNLTPLRRDQVNAIRRFVSANANVAQQQANFTITVGAAVPTSIKLAALPPELVKALPSYANDDFMIVSHQFIVVERQTRRIVAIVPAPVKESTR